MGTYLSRPNVAKESHNGVQGHFKCGVSAMQGWRATMEDSHVMIPRLTEDVSLFAVFDGHGGSGVAKFCEKYLPIELLKNQSFIAQRYNEALEEIFLHMDRMLIEDKEKAFSKEFGEEGVEDFSLTGTTAVVALVTSTSLYIAHAGDSRAVLYLDSGEVVPLTTDHKPELEREKTRIAKAGGYIVDGRVNGNLNLTRALGDFEYKKDPSLRPDQQIISPFPDVVVRPLSGEEHFLLIGCDGIWDTHPCKVVGSIVREKLTTHPSKKLSAIVEDLLDRLLARDTSEGSGCDNMTAILVLFKH